MLMRVLYASQMTHGVTADEIARLVAAAQQRNRRLDLTGALLRCDHNFVQVIEGHRSNVVPMLASIHADPRHYDMRLFLEEQVPTRLFDDFAMGYVMRLELLEAVERLRAGEIAPDDFIKLMVQIIKEEPTYPFAR